MATPWSSNAAAAAAVMQADIGDARRVLITQAPDLDDCFHDQREEEALQARRNPDPKDSRVLNAWNSFQHNDPTPDLEARAMPPITHGGVTHRLNRLAAGNLSPRIAAPLPTGDLARGRGSRGTSTNEGAPRTRRNAQNTRASGVGSKNTSGQNHYAVNQFNYLPRVGLLASENASALPNPRTGPATTPPGPSTRRRHRRNSSAGRGGQQVRSLTPAASPSTARAVRPTGNLASPETFMAAVYASRGLATAPSAPGRAGPSSEGVQRRPAFYPGVAERPVLSPSTVERGSALLHAEDPAESTAILSGSDTSGNCNAGNNCDASSNGTGNGNGDSTGNDNGNRTGSGNDENVSSGDGNGMNHRGCQFSSEQLNTVLSRVENFTSMLNARSQRPFKPLPARRHHPEALSVEVPRVEIPSENTRTDEPREKDPCRSGLWDSKWAPRD